MPKHETTGVDPAQPVLSALALVENCFLVVHVPQELWYAPDANQGCTNCGNCGNCEQADKPEDVPAGKRFVEEQLAAMPGGIAQLGRVYVPSEDKRFIFQVVNLRQTTPIYE